MQMVVYVLLHYGAPTVVVVISSRFREEEESSKLGAREFSSNGGSNLVIEYSFKFCVLLQERRDGVNAVCSPCTFGAPRGARANTVGRRGTVCSPAARDRDREGHDTDTVRHESGFEKRVPSVSLAGQGAGHMPCHAAGT